jgi:predicted metalloendopeptidase
MKRNLSIIAAIVCALMATHVLSGQENPYAGRLGIDVSGMDRSVRPQDDFFRYVNGAWADKAEIPPDKSRYGSFIMLGDESERALKEIVEEAAAQKDAPHGSDVQKVGDLYRSFMDTNRIEALGIKPLKPHLDYIAKMNSTADVAAAIFHLSGLGVGTVVLRASVQQDPKNSAVYTVIVNQAQLGMPDRDYYLRQDAKFESIRHAYTDYIAQLFMLAGRPDPRGAAQRILELETKIAEKQWDRVHNRDPEATYNKMSLAQLSSLVPVLKWSETFRTLTNTAVTDVVVRQPDYASAADAIIKATPAGTWKEYFTFGLLHEYANDLPDAFVQARFNFSGRVIAGQKEIRPRWKRGVANVEDILGEPAGKLYVEKYFSPQAKARMDAMVKNIFAAFKSGIDSLDWMTPDTKAHAQEKLAKYTVKIGYPDQWRDYSGLEIKPDDVIGNAIHSSEFEHADNWGLLGKPVERWRWGMTPQTVNAYYNSRNNEIVFPAAILQPPFFNVNADDAVNYGGIGVVIGHEISHGFDDQGRKSDGDGNLRDWWTPEDAKAFEARAAKLGAEFESYDPLPGLKINGRQTMGENIGDLSGLAVAYHAYQISLHGAEAPIVDGFTGDQRFFMGYAQIWRDKMRDEELRNRLLTDPHSPGMFRAFVPLTNFDAWYEAFNVGPGDKLYRRPEERVKFW